jgi:tetrapyrrole methylase family protein/MazG family protein
MTLLIDPIIKSLGELPAQLTVVDAHHLSHRYHPTFPPSTPALIFNLNSQEIAAKVKLVLLTVYSPEHQVKLIQSAGKSEEFALNQFDHNKRLAEGSSLYVPPLGANTSFEEFQELIAHLRAPDGCPWDREQTHLSLRRNLIEETYEVVDALDGEDPKEMEEEFGDLMLQMVLQAQIANEAGEFRMADVLNGIITKLIARHPHVFGDMELSDANSVIANWEHIKSEERKAKGENRGILDGVAAALPALSQAEQYQSRVARVGFEWREIEGVLDKVAEEVQELREAKDDSEREAEYGDLLFVLVNLARWLKLDPEAALRAANGRFKRRFAYVEVGAKAQGRELKDMTLEEMDALWEEGKAADLKI